MATLFIDYEQQVREAYKRGKENGTLPHGLLHLTPANLKDECLKRCTKDVNRRDERVIRDFCGDLNESRNCHAIIQRCETDKFRPLVNYLKGKSVSTDAKNIELLAWLIDFPGRPWEMGKKYAGEEDTNVDPVSNGPGPATEDQVTTSEVSAGTPVIKDDKPTVNPVIPKNPIIKDRIAGSEGAERLKGKSTKKLAVAFMLSLVVGTGGMWWWMNENRPLGGCMYWHEDHYEPIACSQKIPNMRIIALDTIKLKNFRKLTRPDTITYLAIGKVWYSKIEGKLEYYTSEGEHPVAYHRQLRPITKYIIDKYILPGMQTKKDVTGER